MYGTQNSNDMVVQIPVTRQFQDAIANALKMGAASQKVKESIQKLRPESRAFKKWKMEYIRRKHGLEFLTQQRTQDVEYSITKSVSESDLIGDHTRKLVGALLRYKSRRSARAFWIWQHQVKSYSTETVTKHN